MSEVVAELVEFVLKTKNEGCLSGVKFLSWWDLAKLMHAECIQHWDKQHDTFMLKHFIEYSLSSSSRSYCVSLENCNRKYCNKMQTMTLFIFTMTDRIYVLLQSAMKHLKLAWPRLSETNKLNFLLILVVNNKKSLFPRQLLNLVTRALLEQSIRSFALIT